MLLAHPLCLRHQVLCHLWACSQSLWDTSRGLHGIGCTVEPLCQLGGRRGKQQEGAEELQPTLLYLIKEKGNVVKGLTLECPEPLGQEKDSLWPPQMGSATSP